MIATLSGRLKRKSVDYLIVDVAGVGYQVQAPLSTYYSIPGIDEEITLFIHTYVREDTLALFGFFTEQEKDMFLLLMGVSGIGPRLALAVLSSLSVAEIVTALQSSDDSRLNSIPGIGKKTAARMVLELKDKVKPEAPGASPQDSGAWGAGRVEDAASALVNLGFKKPQADEALKRIGQADPTLGVEGLIRESLKVLMKR